MVTDGVDMPVVELEFPVIVMSLVFFKLAADPTFPVTVEIPSISSMQRELIHVGMNAKVEVAIKTPPQITIPITAVFQEQGQNKVTIIDPTTGKPKTVSVSTGATTQNNVIIHSGIKAGTQVIVPK